jgi:hypothetical protein
MKTYTQLLNELKLPMMNKAWKQRLLKTVNPKNIKKAPENFQKLGRTTELIGKKIRRPGGSVTSGALEVGGRTMQNVAPNPPYMQAHKRWQERVWKDV